MILTVICHFLHLAAACASLGGLLYARVVLLPGLSSLSETERSAFLSHMIRRFSYIKWTSVVLIAISGVYQLAKIFPHVENKSLYLVAFALKMTGALGLFMVTFLLTLPGTSSIQLQKNRAFWSAVNLGFACIILAGTVWMKQIR